MPLPYIGAHRIAGDRSFGAYLSFEKQRLDGYSLYLTDARCGTSWNDWAEEKELARRDVASRDARAGSAHAAPRWLGAHILLRVGRGLVDVRRALGLVEHRCTLSAVTLRTLGDGGH
jgi:hypothetical protein